MICYRSKAPVFFDSGDTPYVECQLRLSDGTVEHISIETWHSHRIGQSVKGDIRGGFFSVEKQDSDFAVSQQRSMPFQSYASPAQEAPEPPQDNRPFKPWKGRTQSYTRQ